MKSLFKYLKPFKKEIILGPCFKLTEAVLELIVPLIMANIIDVGIKNSDKGYVLSNGALMVALSATGLGCALVCQYFAAKASQGFGTVLRNELFAHISKLPHRQINEIGVSGLTTRISNDINQLQLGVAMFIRLAVRAPFLVIGAVIMAMTIDIKLSLIFIVTAVLIAAVLYIIMSRTPRFYTAVQKLLDRVSTVTRDNLSGARVIRAFSRQEGERKKFSGAGDELLETQLRVGRISALLNPATYLIVNVGIVALLWFGGAGVNAGELEQGQIVALVNYMTQILLALIVLANLVIIFTKAGASGERVAEALNTKPAISNAKTERIQYKNSEVAVEFRDVDFAYGSKGDYALCGINLKIERGQTVGIIGGTGSGKSTLINLIPRFYEASKGVVYVDGEDVKKYPPDQLRERIGIVPQRTLLFAGTVRDNVKLGAKDADDAQVLKALTAAQADFVLDNKKGGLDAQVRQGGRNLSGGQRQRISIARALARDPEILILDDASSALDFATDAKLRAAVRAYREGMTVIMVSQRVPALKDADKIVVMDDGEMLGVGTHDELFETNEVYREICLSQMY